MRARGQARTVTGDVPGGSRPVGGTAVPEAAAGYGGGHDGACQADALLVVGPPASQRRIDLGPRGRTGTVLVHRRSAVVTGVLLAGALAVGTLTLLTGTYEISGAGALRALWGQGGEVDQFIVLGQRLPRVLAALLTGGLLALSGAVFQSLSRNPLGSPDIVGFTTGAATGGLLTILLSGISTATTLALGAVAGGLATAAAVVLVALRRGVGGESLVLAGIALSEMLSALNDYLLARAPIESAEAARAWQLGSLNAVSWAQLRPLLVGAAVLLPLVVCLYRPAGVLEMGEDTATSLGVGVGRLRGAMLGYGVVLACVCVSVTGPIGFVALAAPQLARWLSRSSGTTLVASAAMGAFLLVVADLLAQRLLAPFQIPVGLVSSACGGLYLLWLLGRRGDSQSIRC